MDQSENHLKDSFEYSALKLKHGDIIEISGYYFTWEVRDDYSHVLDKFCLHAVAQDGLIHSDLIRNKIISINGKKV